MSCPGAIFMENLNQRGCKGSLEHALHVQACLLSFGQTGHYLGCPKSIEIAYRLLAFAWAGEAVLDEFESVARWSLPLSHVHSRVQSVTPRHLRRMRGLVHVVHRFPFSSRPYLLESLELSADTNTSSSLVRKFSTFNV